MLLAPTLPPSFRLASCDCTTDICACKADRRCTSAASCEPLQLDATLIDFIDDSETDWPVPGRAMATQNVTDFATDSEKREQARSHQRGAFCDGIGAHCHTACRSGAMANDAAKKRVIINAQLMSKYRKIILGVNVRSAAQALAATES